jgi:hypothetical protein
MPRKARLDVPGALHHIFVREGTTLFRPLLQAALDCALEDLDQGAHIKILNSFMDRLL